MAEALNSPRRIADLHRSNRVAVRESAGALQSLSIGDRLEVGLRLNHVAVEFANSVVLHAQDD